MTKLIIFDCDGVLVDSEIITNRICADMLTDVGYSITTEENIKRFTGMSGRAVREFVLQELGITLSDETMKEAMEKVVKAMESELLPLNIPIMEYLLSRNVNRCVASNAPRDHVLSALHITKQNHFFDAEHIFTASQVKHAKPAPDLFLFAAKEMGFDPKDCLVIEDSLIGIQAALAANMKVIGYLGGRHTHFDWYKSMIHDLQIPYAHNSQELLQIIDDFIDGKKT